MAASQTDRLEIFTWSSGADTFTRTQMNTSHDKLEALGAGFDQTGSTVPTAKAIAKYKGFFHYSTSNTDAGTLSYCNGAAWFEIGKLGSAVAIDGTLADGSSTLVARADHKHSISNNTITNAMMADNAIDTDELADNAVTTVKITNAHVTNDKLAASGLDISKMTTGTLDVGRIGAGTILNAKLGSDIDASKITDGTLPIARIGAGTVSLDKIANSTGLSVIGRSANSGGVVADITAGSDNQVLLRNGTSLEFATIGTDNITANAVSVDKIEEVVAHGILARVAGTGGDLSELAATDDTVLGKLSGNNLAFGKITNAQLDGSITKDKISSVNASAVDGELAAGNFGNNTIALGTKTTGNYVASLTPGTVGGTAGIGLSNTGSEGGTWTISHANTSSVSSTSNGNNDVVQDLVFDTYGHVTGVTSYDLDNLYYRETEINTRMNSLYSVGSGYGGYKITYGTAAPNNSDGYNNGSIYLQYT
jgi:surface antigen